MANENDNINPESIQHPDHPEHHTWLQSLAEKIHNLDTEFPLSGGETEEDFARVDAHEEEETKDITAKDATTEEKKPAEEHKEGEHKEHHNIFENLIHKIQNIDSDFPLSGGEEE